MKLTSFTLLLLAFSITINAQSKISLEIDAKLPAKHTRDTSRYIATAASQMFPFVELTINKVKYTIAFDPDNRKIKYIYTQDKNFVDSNGFKVSQEVSVLYNDIEVLDYFQLRLKPDKNGWQVVLGGGFALDRNLINRIEKDGKLTTKIQGFAKGYNY